MGECKNCEPRMNGLHKKIDEKVGIWVIVLMVTILVGTIGGSFIYTNNNIAKLSDKLQQVQLTVNTIELEQKHIKEDIMDFKKKGEL